MSQVFEHLLLATERTEFDTGAERLAISMAQRCGQPLAVVMPLAGNPEYEAVAPALAERADRAAAASLTPLRDQARAAGVPLDLRVRHGTEADREIVEEAQERAADLIVIRRRGRRSFLAQLLVGEMVAKVLAHAPCSVLVVPRDAAPWSRRVLLAAEPGLQGQMLLALATALASEAALPLTVACILASDATELRAAAEAFIAEALRNARQAGVSVDGEVLVGAPSSQILDAARRHGADLIVMGSRSAARTGRARVGVVAQQVTGQVDCAVLLAHPVTPRKDVSS
jgi:nucleotide-binding universal stress UspA family protein